MSQQLIQKTALVGGFLEADFEYLFVEKFRAPTHDLVSLSPAGLSFIEYIWRYLNYRVGGFSSYPFFIRPFC